MNAGQPGSGSIASTAERIREMLVTAERIAEDIRREATAEAERYLAERRREADALVADRRERFEQALEILRAAGPEIERRLSEVQAALAGALADGQPAQRPAAEPPATATAPAAAEEPPAPAPETQPAASRDSAPASTSHTRQRALIRATQLAVQGADRVTVKETIEREFELDDGAAIVDEILGSD